MLPSLRWPLPPPQGLWEQCQLLKSASVFARCHPLVDPEPFVALCEKMLCPCAQGLQCPCPALLEYARACAQQGMLLYGWMDHSLCRESVWDPHPLVAGAWFSVPFWKLSGCHTSASQGLLRPRSWGPVPAQLLPSVTWAQSTLPSLKALMKLERPS